MPTDYSIKFIFGNSIAAMLARAEFIGFSSRKRDICRSFAKGFGLSQSQADDIFTNGIDNYDLTTLSPFSTSTIFETYETNVKSILSSYGPTSTLNNSNKTLLAAGVNAILFGYIGNPNVDSGDLIVPIGNVLFFLSRDIIGNNEIFERNDDGIVVHPFTKRIIDGLFVTNNYTLIYQSLASIEKTIETDVVHYNFYDTTKIFSHPDLDKMKDCENQYYYLSGRLYYDNFTSGINFCETDVVSINTPTGITQISIYKNEPCTEESSFIGPVTGTKFYREFNDGPYSSGNFSKEIKSSFIDLDKKKLSKQQYSSNYSKLFVYGSTGTSGSLVTLLNSNDSIIFDAEGEYNLTEEYKYSPIPTGDYAKYQIMHIGDARKRSQCLSYDINGNCTSAIEKNTTGFKFALIEMDEDIWANSYAYILTNPYNSGQNLVKRAINLSKNPYISSNYGSGLLAASYHVNGPQWYVGPPQLNESILPYFAFTEGFQNVTYGSGVYLNLYAAIGTSNVNGGESNRSFQTSIIPFYSGKDNTYFSVQVGYEQNRFPKLVVKQSLSSKDLIDDVQKKVFGMGDSFSGKYPFSQTKEENAGYFYSGYTFNGFSGTEWDLIRQNSGFTVGSPSTTITYISGYTGKATIEINKLVANDGSGRNVDYYYFDNRLLPNGLNVNQTGWSSFAPIPTGIENISDYGRQYAEMKVENARQRYYQGPYASYQNKFLYPNAKLTTNTYRPENGFPTKFRYKIRVREETVKEFYCKFKISEGITYQSPIYTNVVRPTGSNFGALQPKMVGLFSAGGYNFDFNLWNINKVNFFYNKSLANAVDNSYAPYTDSYLEMTTVYVAASGKNAEVYQNQPEFKQGILLTGNSVIIHRSYSGSSYRASGRNWFSPKPAAVGLYHGFTGYDITGYLTYNKPIFDLKSGIINRERVLSALPLFKEGCVSYLDTPFKIPSYALGINNLYTKNLNGKSFYSKSGNDPFYFEDMGGRRGEGNSSTGQGGYHSKDIIGDEWIDLNVKTFGYYCSANGDVCNDDYNNPIVNTNYGIEARVNDNRLPYYDEKWFFIEGKPNKLKIHTRALKYNPGTYNYINNPFTSSSSIKTENSSGSLIYRNDIKAFSLDLNEIFPKRRLTKTSEWYINPSGSGYKIGPFDRDVEIFVDSGSILTGYNSLYINQRKLSDFASGVSDGTESTCSVPKRISGAVVDYGYGNYQHIRPLVFVPSGNYAYINTFSQETGGYNYNFTSKGDPIDLEQN